MSLGAWNDPDDVVGLLRRGHSTQSFDMLKRGIDRKARAAIPAAAGKPATADAEDTEAVRRIADSLARSMGRVKALVLALQDLRAATARLRAGELRVRGASRDARPSLSRTRYAFSNRGLDGVGSRGFTEKKMKPWQKGLKRGD